jgi:putative ABC transport system permease protein
MSPITAWRLPLRLARRDALRHRARSVLVLVMIALPVLAVTAADVLIQTSTVSGAESVDRRMGASEALVSVSDGVTDVKQPPDPDDCCAVTAGSGDGTDLAPTAEQVSSLLDGATLVELRHGEVEFRTSKGQTPVDVTEVDLRNPVTRGLFDLTSGRWPQESGEVVVNEALLAKGYRLGDTLELTDDAAPDDPRIVGIAESTTIRTYPAAAGPLGAFGVDDVGSSQWLVDGGPVSWATMRQLNQIGATVASRVVIKDPPPASQWPPEVRPTTTDDATVAVLGLIVIMALIEVVLLAGPAFAVSARKQQRSLALMAATGGTPKQSRRVIVASAIVLGSAAAVLGVFLGIGVARLLQPWLQSRADTWFGPFEIPWTHLVGVAGFGMLSALLAALVPAYLASRQDVVAVLAGRRGDKAPSLKSPLLGLVLLGVGIAGSAYGAVGQSSGEFVIAFSAIPAVLGMILVVPVVLAGVARLSGRLPLVLRYAVRDANRHRTRTVPAVAAVAATVAGVVALSIGLSSDEAEREATYTPSVVDGVGIVHDYGEDPPWSALRAVVERELPSATVSELQGLQEKESWSEVFGPGGETVLETSGDALGANIMVSSGGLPVGLRGVGAADVKRAETVLRGGGIVAFVSPGRQVDGATATVVQHRYDPDTGADEGSQQAELPAAFVTLTEAWNGPAAVLSAAAARELGAEPATVALSVEGTISEDQEQAVDEGLSAVAADSGMYVERGYQPDDSTVIAQIVLIVLGGVLMLGGTLTATFLALSDARPDLATLSAVGASPRTRRGVAAAYAVVVGLVGALLGAAVGLIPGIAVAWPLTKTTSGGGVPGEEVFTTVGPFLDIPWLMILGLVVVLPAVTAVVVGLFARSRLPLVARLD